MKFKSIIATLFIIFNSSQIKAQFFANFETGLLFTHYNQVRDGSDGTLISFENDFETITAPFIRLRLGLERKNHHFSVLYAPLNLKKEVTLKRDIRFDGQDFLKGTNTTGNYTFNSYRFTYNYRFIDRPKFRLGFGVSAKVRDAGTTLSSGAISAGNKNQGFVPLINIQSNYRFNKKFGIVLFADGLVAEQGRAEDVLLATTYHASKDLCFQLGYRIFEGGSDGVNNYNFIFLHVASLGMNYTF